MFSNCTNLISLIISNFFSSNNKYRIYLDNMFSGCSSLNSLNLSHFKTSKVDSMTNMFYNCYSMTSLDITNFDTSNVEKMDFMFSGCKKLTSLDLSNFDTQKVKNMSNLFSNCESLETINLSGYNTTSVTNMDSMFAGCKNLLYLDLSNFTISNSVQCSKMFENCKSLIYLNIFQSYINDINDIDFQEVFYNISDEFKYCTNINNSKIIEVLNGTNMIFYCYDTCFQEDRKIITEKKICVEKCEDDEEYNYDYNNICYKSCPNGTYSNNHICEKCYDKCIECQGNGDNINNNCLECIPGLILLNDFNKSNCYEKCDYYYYFDNNGTYHCTEELACPQDYQKLILDENKCVQEYIITTNIIEITDSKEINIVTTYNEKKEQVIEVIEKKDEEILSFKNDVMNNAAILENVTKGQDFVKGDDELILQVTTTENQKSNSNKNISSINLKDCEDKLKFIYGIDPKLPLIIIKIDYYSKDTLIPMVGYEIYHPTNKSKLDLNYCKDILIQLNIPVDIDENDLFKYDPNSEYYTDDCFSYTTDDGTDIILSDRKKEFGEKNMSLCENNCDYTGYNIEDKKSSCDCKVKNKIDLVSEIVNNTQKLSNSFSSEESSSGTSNIITMKCTKTLFTKDGLVKNVSSYVLSVSMIYFLLSILLFIKCGYPLLLRDINDIISSKRERNEQDINQNNVEYINNTEIYYQAPPKKYKYKKDNNLNAIKNNKSNSTAKIDTLNYPKSLIPIKKIIKSKKRNNNKNNKKFNIKNKNKNNKMKRKIPDIINIKPIEFNNFELNSFDYGNALNYDKRTCCEYYIALIRIKHPLFFGFCPIKDYNTMIIKLCIFLLSFDIYYVINFAFFNEKVIHALYKNGGNFDIFYFFPQIVISFAVANSITIIIKLIFLSERNIIELRNQISYSSAVEMSCKVKRSIIRKYIMFYILGIIFLFFFWMLLSSFGAVYQNSQLILFENVLISFGISFIYPFFYNFIPCIFRFCSLSSKNMECIYKTSQFLQVL